MQTVWRNSFGLALACSSGLLQGMVSPHQVDHSDASNSTGLSAFVFTCN